VTLPRRLYKPQLPTASAGGREPSRHKVSDAERAVSAVVAGLESLVELELEHRHAARP